MTNHIDDILALIDGALLRIDSDAYGDGSVPGEPDLEEDEEVCGDDTCTDCNPDEDPTAGFIYPTDR